MCDDDLIRKFLTIRIVPCDNVLETTKDYEDPISEFKRLERDTIGGEEK